MKIAKTLPLSLLVAMVFSFCSTGDDVVPKASAKIDDFFRTIPDWTTETVEPKEEVFLRAVTVQGDVATEEYDCPVYERNLVRTLNNFVSVGTNFGLVWPGAMLEGTSLETGELKLINTKRAPVTLVTNIALEEVSTTIVPNSVTAQQAIADFMIAAGEMPEGSKAGAGSMLFQVEEASTFQQSMLSMGVSAGFTDPQSNVGLDGSLSVSETRNSKTHSVVAKYVQEMFTVRVADDLIDAPAGFFADDFTASDLEALQNTGAMGPDNIPLYIESVTYGRILLFSMQSKTVSSSGELAAALEASMADYANGGGELSKEHEEIFSTATHKIFSAGGTDAAANAAIASLDWSKFFVESPPSSAVPISFVAKTVNGKKIVNLVQSEVYEQRDDCLLIEPPAPQAPISYDITVTWTETKNSGYCFGDTRFGTCSPGASTWTEGTLVPTPLTAANGYSASFTLYPNADGDDNPVNDKMKIIVHSKSRLWVPFGPLGGVPKTTSNSYDVRTLAEGNHTVKHRFANAVGSVMLTYQIKRTANY